MGSGARGELERETRRLRINPRLKAAGWEVVPFVPGAPLEVFGSKVAIEEFETINGPADYALWDHNEALGVVEAKRITLGPSAC